MTPRLLDSPFPPALLPDLVTPFRGALLAPELPFVRPDRTVTDPVCRDTRIPRRWRERDCHALTLALHLVTGALPWGSYCTRIDGCPGDFGEDGCLDHSGVVLETADGGWLADAHGWTPASEMEAVALSYDHSGAWYYLAPDVLVARLRHDSLTAVIHEAMPVVAHLLRTAPVGLAELHPAIRPPWIAGWGREFPADVWPWLGAEGPGPDLQRVVTTWIGEVG